MKKIILIVSVILTLTSQKGISSYAPVSTVVNTVSSSSFVTVPVTVSNFINIGSFNLILIYDPAVISVTGITSGSLLGGALTSDLTVPGTISVGWYTWPGVTLQDNSTLFTISVTKTTGCTSSITWSDNGYSCIWYDGNWNPSIDTPTTNYYINGSVTFALPLSSDFIASNTTPLKNTTVLFTDQTTGCPVNWDWSFDRTSVIFVNSTTAQSQNPQVQFTDGGLYTVTLITHNANYNNTKIKTGYIRAGTPGQWTGTTSASWMTGFNWDTWGVPEPSCDVVIPSQVPNFPEFTENLTLGSTCKSITLEGASQLSITGNFTINPGSSLTFTSNGTLTVGGDWVNNGVYSAGTGTVDFTGTNSASILPGNPPTIINVFYNLKLSKTLATLHIVPDIIVNHDLLINP